MFAGVETLKCCASTWFCEKRSHLHHGGSHLHHDLVASHSGSGVRPHGWWRIYTICENGSHRHPWRRHLHMICTFVEALGQQIREESSTTWQIRQDVHDLRLSYVIQPDLFVTHVFWGNEQHDLCQHLAWFGDTPKNVRENNKSGRNTANNVKITANQAKHDLQNILPDTPQQIRAFSSPVKSLLSQFRLTCNK